MTTLTKIIVTTLLSLLFFSCNFDINLGPGEVGNGNVVEKTRTINEPYEAIKVSEGLDVYVTQSDEESIVVEADENLQELIIVEVVDNVLKIHTKKNIGRATSKKVMVSFKNISSVISTSGSYVNATNTITAENLKLESNSGSSMDLNVDANNVNSNASSGASIKLIGKTIKLKAEASSGSSIIANELITESSEANVSSGASITVNTTKKLIANANSGGHINYYGNPESVEQNKSMSGGSISKQ
jgi:Putative auto-transporter adhesin, head GIN domain